MLNIKAIEQLAGKHCVPTEDALFIALNTNGVNFACDYNRMRMALHLTDSERFARAKQRGELDYFFALPVNPRSPFVLTDGALALQDFPIGRAIGETEDTCDSHYLRRGGTVLNLNSHSRTTCRGCRFCYTEYQASAETQRFETESDLRGFFASWMFGQGLPDLSHLVQVAVVTGCYESSEELCRFLRLLRRALTEYRFDGEIFYLGSQVTTPEQLRSLEEIKPFTICFSLETFERRELLRKDKASVTPEDVRASMDFARALGYNVTFSYIVGMESPAVMEAHFPVFKEHVNKFPVINILQIHKGQDEALADQAAHRLDYYLESRLLIEHVFAETEMRPLVWEDYRSLWFLTFNGEPLRGARTP
jgi:hypothetical protein